MLLLDFLRKQLQCLRKLQSMVEQLSSSATNSTVPAHKVSYLIGTTYFEVDKTAEPFTQQPNL